MITKWTGSELILSFDDRDISLNIEETKEFENWVMERVNRIKRLIPPVIEGDEEEFNSSEDMREALADGQLDAEDCPLDDADEREAQGFDVPDEFNGDRFFMDVSFPKSKLYVQKGEEFTAGFRLINSYNKQTGVIVVPRLMRLICSNGMVMPSGFAQEFSYRHNQEMVENFAKYVEEALKQTINSNDKLKAMVNDCISDSIEYKLAIKVLTHLVKTSKHIDAIQNIIEQSGDKLDRWTLYGAVTNYATHGENLSVNVETALQNKAKQILTTPYEQLLAIVPKEEQ